jgi:hypothetical protein
MIRGDHHAAKMLSCTVAENITWLLIPNVGVRLSLTREECLQVHSQEHWIWKEDLCCEKLGCFLFFFIAIYRSYIQGHYALLVFLFFFIAIYRS